jgi:hypothetical protein
MAYKRDSKTLEDSYKHFKENHDIKVSKRVYKDICKDFNKAIAHKVLTEAYEFRLPYRLGSLRIKGQKMSFKDKRTLRIDYQKTKELGHTVYHLNNHTNNYMYRWWWNKMLAIVKNKGAYLFKPTREHKRTLAKLLKEGKAEYFT